MKCKHLVCLLGILCFLRTSAQITHSAVSRGQIAPFDLRATELGPRFRGADVEQIYLALMARRSSFTKSEYERQAEFAERVKEFKHHQLFGGLTPDGLFAFVLPARCSYDAEAQVSTVTYDDVWASTTRPGSSYVGSNSFGVRKVIARKKRTSLVIEHRDPDWLEASYRRSTGILPSLSETGFLLPMTSKEAEKSADRVGVILIGSLEEPFVEREIGGSEPTISDPVDLTTVDQSIYIDLVAVWLVDRQTGRILKKVDEDSYKDEWPVQITVSNSLEAYSATVKVDGVDQTNKLRFSSGPVRFIAKNEIDVFAHSYAEKKPNFEVLRNGQPIPWACNSKSGMQECSVHVN